MPAPNLQELKTDSLLTKAETKVASGYVSGMIGKEIADTLGISHTTVLHHTQHIYDKAGIPRSTNSLVAWFLSKNFDLDLSEFRRRLGAFILLAITTLQIASQDFDNNPIRRFPTRRLTESKARSRKKDEGNTYEL